MRNLRLSIAVIPFLAMLGFSCVKEDYFGKSGFKQILYFSIPGQASSTTILQDSLVIRLEMPPGSSLSALAADSIQLSSYARVSPAAGQWVDFTQPVAFTVTAEDGSTVEYTVYVTRGSSTPQLDNSGLDDWYTPAGKNYQEPGTDDNTIWATGNAGVVTLSSANVKPYTLSGSDNAAELITRDLGTLGQLTGQRMAAGTIFTGKFVLDIANPLNSTKFGTPFVGRPRSVTLAYAYEPGAPYRNGSGQTLTKSDSCDIYVLLENRENNIVTRVATGWFRSGSLQASLRDITLTLTYGPLPVGTPVYQYPTAGPMGSGNETVTHITVVAASSAYGAVYEGGTNSRLLVNDVRMNY